MSQITESWAVITGASSGIGKSFAILLAAKGYQLVLIARRREPMEELAARLERRYGTECRIITADLSKEAEVDRCCEALGDLDVDVFINNAGLGEAGPFLQTDGAKELFMVDVNVRAVHQFTKRMLAYFDRRGGGSLLNVASSAGLLPGGPYMAAYYATKAYVVSLTRAIARELEEAGSPVYIGCLCPGPVNTEFNDVANVRFALPGISPEKCVAAAWRGMRRGQVVIVPTLLMKLATAGSRLLPVKVALRITGRQQKRKL